ncbi:MAG: signal peptidase I [Thermoleophilia bacterium]
MTLRISTILFAIVTLAVAVLGWLFLGPVQLGGSTGYVITKGSSMQPLIQQGDLVVLRRHSSYQVGDVVGYHNSALHHVVLHRIIAVNGDKLTMKGDNNNFVDSQHPAMSDVVGEKWFRLPRVGSAMIWIQKPTNAGILALGAMILAAAGTEGVRKRKKVKGGGPAAVQPKTPRRIGAAWIAPAVVLALSCILGLAAFGRSTTTTVSRPGAYQETGDFSYIGHTQPSALYPTGVIKTHQTAFTKLVSSVNMNFRYMLSSLRPAAVSGQKWMKLRLTSVDTGWSRTFVVAPPTRFSGPTTTVHGTVSLAQLAGVMLQLQNQTKILSTNYKVSILPGVHVKGAIGGQPIDKTFSSQLDFVFDGLKFAIDQGSGVGTSHSATHVMSIGTGDVQQKQSIDLRILKLSVNSARAVALVGIVLALLGFAAVSGLAVMRRRADEPAVIDRLYSHLLLPVSNLPQVGHVVDVDSMDALANLADRYDRSILHYQEGGEHTYLLQDEGVVYRYLVVENGLASVEQVLPVAPPAPVAVAAPPTPNGPSPAPVGPPQYPQPPRPPGADGFPEQ